jgi:hypothetical protein
MARSQGVYYRNGMRVPDNRSSNAKKVGLCLIAAACFGVIAAFVSDNVAGEDYAHYVSSNAYFPEVKALQSKHSMVAQAQIHTTTALATGLSQLANSLVQSLASGNESNLSSFSISNNFSKNISMPPGATRLAITKSAAPLEEGCAFLENSTKWPAEAVLSFAAHEIRKHVPDAAKSTGNLLCEMAWRQMLGTPSLWLHGKLAGTANASMSFIIQLQSLEGMRASSLLVKHPNMVNSLGLHNTTVAFHNTRVVQSKGGKGNTVNVSMSAKHEEHNKYMLRLVKVVENKRDLAIPISIWGALQRESLSGSISWTPQLYEETVAMTQDEMRRTKLGHIPLTPEQNAMVPVQPEPTMQQLAANPPSWDPRTDASTKMCWGPERIADQGTCGACFAFASALAYSARLCKATKGVINVPISEQRVVSCLRDYSGYFANADGSLGGDIAGAADGCNGGNAIQVWLQMQNDGRPMRTCDPYVAKGHTAHGCGQNKCNAPLNYKSGLKVTQVPKTQAALQTALYVDGPVYSGITCWSDFFNYKSGVYSKSATATNQGGHAVTAIGYGTEGSTFYWLMANSWGHSWGEQGYWRADMKFILDGDLYAVNTPTDQKCATTSCGNGDPDAECKCQCRPNWSAKTAGGPCTVCTDHCNGKGTLDSTDCSCKCQAGYFGASCNNFILGYWKTIDIGKLKATIEFKWDIAEERWKGDSKISKYAKAPAQANPQIEGTSIAMTTRKGSLSVENALDEEVPGFPKNQYAYAVKLSLGKNEFGSSKGYTYVDVPTFLYDTTANPACLKGGNPVPSNIAASIKPLCAGAAAAATTAAAVATPAPHAPMPTVASTTAAATAAAAATTAAAGSTTAASTTQSAATGVPTLAPTKAPTLHPTLNPTLAPTNTPTVPPTATMPSGRR